ncbi:hypothetical protein N7326_07990, partial [Corynebacterium sp. ES2794-CONJ1]|uniref:hypothetical protein n=1 Tax=Corynebacterium sp. ES2794-CONJ1 TaxID=2980553 RepID=UPI0021D9B4ED
NPKVADTDGDGVNDGDEINTMVDENGKTVPNPAQTDEKTDPNVAGTGMGPDNSGSSKAMTPGAIAGIVAGVLSAILLLLNIPAITAFLQGIFHVPAPAPQPEKPMKPGLKKGIAKGKGFVK